MPAQMYLLETPSAGNGFVRTLVDKLFRRKFSLLLLVLAWTAAVEAYVYFQPPSYEHEIRFLVRNNRVGAAVTPESNNGPVYRDYIDETILATEIEVLSSPTLLRSVVEQCQLAEGEDGEAAEKALKNLKKDLKIGRVQKANVIKATYADSDPEQVEAVLSTLADGFLKEHLRTHSASGAHELFDQQAHVYEQRLQELQKELTEFQTKNSIVLLGEQKDLSVKHLLDLDGALQGTQTARVENTRKIALLKEQLGTLETRITTQSREVPNQYSIERLNTMLVELRNRHTQLLTKYQPDDRLVKEVVKQIEDTEASLGEANASIATEKSSDVNPIRQSVQGELVKAEVNEAEYRARVSGLERQIAEQRKSLHGLRASTSGEEHLVRQIKEAESSFFLYSKKREDARIENVMDRERISNVMLIEPPRAPITPQPSISLTLIATYLLGCLLILGFGLARAMTDATVYSTWELEGITGSPVLAAVPHEGSKRGPASFFALQLRN